MKKTAISTAVKAAVISTSLAGLTSTANAEIQAFESLKMSGFATIAFSQSDTSYETDSGITDSVAIEPDSVIGLQFDSNISDYTSFTLQLIARGDNSHALTGKSDFEPDVEWAFITLKPADGHRLKLGRMRLPVYMLSETLEVGATYPWVRPPQEVYGQVPSTQLQGVSYEYSVYFDDWEIFVNPYVSLEFETETLSTSGQMGIVANFANDNHIIRASIHEVQNLTIDTQGIGLATIAVDQATVASGAIPGYTTGAVDATYAAATQAEIDDQYTKVDITLAGLGYQYTNENIFIITEAAYIGNDSPLVGDVMSGYFTFGMTFGKFQPHLTIARAETIDDDEREEYFEEDLNYLDIIPGAYNPGKIVIQEERFLYSNNLDAQRTSYTAGLKWNYDARSSIKLDVQYLTDFGDTNGFMGESDSTTRAFTGPQSEGDDSVMIYRLAVTTTF